ncbi:MAG: hypothetical protein A4E34_02253 [Methanoregula sp. PtaU1.Bin006]|uniref:metal-dependent hydrolase n=1 Tax=Methanoregula sp. PtaU1.Bin006 TaxID=1811681 RepID=UPI0009CF8742|nr:metal-dependent hydrolase [Methanoregula sp. PtaU1.Bin006]OPY32876.1 MAG: hypothetical protein A4E34_02253 [Methanoregula sp. PtaU1.Bin006]
MLTRHHILITFIFWLIPCTAYQWTDPLVPVMALAGATAGTILPDIHMKRPSRIRLLVLAWVLTRIGRILVMPLICVFYRVVAGINTSPGDKRLTHAVPGMILYAILCATPFLVGALLFPIQPATLFLMVFSGGIVMGMSIHLVQDLCTRKGIMPLYPFSELAVSGSIRPCDISDPRITRFHVLLVTAFCSFLIVQITAPPLFGYSAPACGFGIAGICLLIMVGQSGVEFSLQKVHPSLPQQKTSGITGTDFSGSQR